MIRYVSHHGIGLEFISGPYIELGLRNLGAVQRSFGEGVAGVLREPLRHLNELLQKSIIDPCLHKNARARRAYLSC